MSRFRFAATALCLAALPCSPARSQVMIDVSKITCEQFVKYKVTDPKYISLWLKGYFDGKKNNTLIDAQKLSDEADKLYNYCPRNQEVLVFKAVSNLFGVDK